MAANEHWACECQMGKLWSCRQRRLVASTENAAKVGTRIETEKLSLIATKNRLADRNHHLANTRNNHWTAIETEPLLRSSDSCNSTTRDANRLHRLSNTGKQHYSNHLQFLDEHAEWLQTATVLERTVLHERFKCTNVLYALCSLLAVFAPHSACHLAWISRIIDRYLRVHRGRHTDHLWWRYLC